MAGSISPPAEAAASSTQDKIIPTTRWPRAKLQKASHAIGFQKGYNFTLCMIPFHGSVPALLRHTTVIIFAGAMLGFTLARFSYVNIGGSAPSSFANSAAPGEWYWYRKGLYRVGITLHLCAILPAGFLMVFQFVPLIRYKLLLFHRMNGYAIILLVLIANAGALMICRRSFGGGIDTQAGVGVLVIVSTTSMALAWYNIKCLQIDQHRKWMLRAMFTLGTIITLRLILIISARITSRIGTFDTVKSCAEIFYIHNNNNETLARLYPQCVGPVASVANQLVVVHATWKNNQPDQIGASLDMSFGMALWLSLFLHLVGVEIYLALTPRENERLRQVSYERQLERGMKSPGSAGLTAEKFGDAEKWTPARAHSG